MDTIIIIGVVVIVLFIFAFLYLKILIDNQNESINKLMQITGKGFEAVSPWGFIPYMSRSPKDYESLTEKLKSLDYDFRLLCNHLKVVPSTKSEERIIVDYGKKSTTNKKGK